MHVIATAGHVDHGKSTLVRALTGMEPDRLEEERRRGLTIELGYVWAQLTPSAEPIAFVDVPGHHRFLSTMLAGVGPVPAAMLVVAADGGWEAQTGEHVMALDALGVHFCVVAITRSDLADPEPVRADVLKRLAGTSLAESGAPEVVAVSGRTRAGLPELRAALDRLTSRLPEPQRSGRIRLWVDRSFTIGGAGTVVTGTLGEGTLQVGDELELAGVEGIRPVRVRGLQALERREQVIPAVARVAVNLRGVNVADVSRGDALLSPGQDLRTAAADVRFTSPDVEVSELASQLVLHIGAASVPVRVRPLGGPFARLALQWPLALRRGDRAVLRDPGRHAVAAGISVADVDPPSLSRRGGARARTAALEHGLDATVEVARRGAVRRERLQLLGVLRAGARLPEGVREVAGLVVTQRDWQRWADSLSEAVAEASERDPLGPGLSPAEAAVHIGVPDVALMDELITAAGLQVKAGRLAATPRFAPPVQQALDELAGRLRANPFDAPEANDLAAAGLTVQVLAAAERAGLLLRLPGQTGPVVLPPDALEVAVRRLRDVGSPFTVSDARRVWETSRRVAVPLLEQLDATRRTRRLENGTRLLLPGQDDPAA